MEYDALIYWLRVANKSNSKALKSRVFKQLNKYRSRLNKG